jgi:hypothetical protein
MSGAALGGVRSSLGGAVVGELHRLEAALANRDGSDVPEGLAALIADDFVEFGASGRRWTAAEVRALVEAGPDALPRLALEDFAAAELAPGVVLVTYRLAGERPSQRSSIWVRRGDGWAMRFHQGTLIPA